ncbi:uncharacterized protein LOC119684886 [Teleopsis dalmanni]|uniref:uncharacterized protein LOC119684886 n=1 Tax=Teleopsis dalmanni TaxID=139649 RepID=UPI0018CDA27F|nr:uncharacterized protein LOC119684886 [Teleopsis dalmanni]
MKRLFNLKNHAALQQFSSNPEQVTTNEIPKGLVANLIKFWEGRSTNSPPQLAISPGIIRYFNGDTEEPSSPVQGSLMSIEEVDSTNALDTHLCQNEISYNDMSEPD